MTAQQATTQPQFTNIPDRIVKFPETISMVGISRSGIYRRMSPDDPLHDPTFPKPVRLGPDRNSPVGWKLSALQKWIAALESVE